LRRRGSHIAALVVSPRCTATQYQQQRQYQARQLAHRTLIHPCFNHIDAILAKKIKVGTTEKNPKKSGVTIGTATPQGAKKQRGVEL
jgi:hypothetical protein